jgi:hypothetical protein
VPSSDRRELLGKVEKRVSEFVVNGRALVRHRFLYWVWREANP